MNKYLSIVLFFSIYQAGFAQLTLTKNLAPVGTKWDNYSKSQFNSTLTAPPNPSGGHNQIWDYDAFYNNLGTEYSGGTNEVIDLNSFSAQDLNTAQSPTYAEKLTNNIGTIIYFYKEVGDTLKLSATKNNNNPIQPSNLNSSNVFIFNLPFNGTLGTLKYVGSGSLKIRGQTFNNVALFEDLSNTNNTKQFQFYQISPYFVINLAWFTFNDVSKNYIINLRIPNNYNLGVIENTSEDIFDIFPNPSSGTFTLQTEKGGVFELMDITGKVINTYHLKNNTETIQTNLPTGMYFIREKESGATQKLIIE